MGIDPNRIFWAQNQEFILVDFDLNFQDMLADGIIGFAYSKETENYLTFVQKLQS